MSFLFVLAFTFLLCCLHLCCRNTSRSLNIQLRHHSTVYTILPDILIACVLVASIDAAIHVMICCCAILNLRLTSMWRFCLWRRCRHIQAVVGNWENSSCCCAGNDPIMGVDCCMCEHKYNNNCWQRAHVITRECLTTHAHVVAWLCIVTRSMTSCAWAFVIHIVILAALFNTRLLSSHRYKISATTRKVSISEMAAWPQCLTNSVRAAPRNLNTIE